METHLRAVGICGDGASELENSNIVMLSEWLQYEERIMPIL